MDGRISSEKQEVMLFVVVVRRYLLYHMLSFRAAECIQFKRINRVQRVLSMMQTNYGLEKSSLHWAGVNIDYVLHGPINVVVDATCDNDI